MRIGHVVLAVAAVLAVGACNKPSEGDCRRAIERIRELTGTSNIRGGKEIETAVRHDLRAVFVVCSDKQWGMVKLTERMGLDPVRTVAAKVLGREGEPVTLPVGPKVVQTAARTMLAPFKDVVARNISEARSINADLGEIRWDELARSMGAYGERVSAPGELQPALRRCLAAGTVAVLHVDVDPEKHLWAPGLKYFKAMHAEPQG